jgi:hypothetical protein
LTAAATQCQQIAIASTNPNAMLSQLKRAVDLLNIESPASELPNAPKSRPVLRVIEGGLSKI